MKEEINSKSLYPYRSLSQESMSLLERDTLKSHLSSFASTKMGKKAILEFEIPLEYDDSKRLLRETIETVSYTHLRAHET